MIQNRFFNAIVSLETMIIDFNKNQKLFIIPAELYLKKKKIIVKL